jgi:hypothetical protein
VSGDGLDPFLEGVGDLVEFIPLPAVQVFGCRVVAHRVPRWFGGIVVTSFLGG